MLYKKILAENKLLEQQINHIQSQLKTLPAGKLICAKNGNRWKWYHSDGKRQTYIPKNQRAFAEQLAIKKYLSCLKEELKREKTALNFYLRHHDSSEKKSTQLLSEHSGYRELLSPYFKPLSQDLEQWQNEPFEQNKKYSDHLIVKASSGNLVRSKSEALIDMFLYTNKIPFRYECPLHLGNTCIYPDFTIRHPKTGKTYYWEHHGRMDDPYYYNNVYPKLQLYNTHGIIPFEQLILTFETKNAPLSAEVVQKIIWHYFL